jgi:hypothetical protein
MQVRIQKLIDNILQENYDYSYEKSDILEILDNNKLNLGTFHDRINNRPLFEGNTLFNKMRKRVNDLK